jgi:hypothetical protein
MADRAYLERLTRRLADDGQLIEAGWIGLRLAAIPMDAPAIQLEEMHKAYMAGAQHLWASIMTMLDSGAEATESDMRKLSLVADELDAYAAKLMADLPTEGSA